jgi:hypothetical protein
VARARVSLLTWKTSACFAIIPPIFSAAVMVVFLSLRKSRSRFGSSTTP